MTLKSKKELRKNNNSNFTLSNIITISAVVLFIGVVIGLSIDSKNERSTNDIAVAQIAFSNNTLKIAKEFACSCGTCGEENLAVCVCGTAMNTKNFIESNLRNGISEREVVELVKDIYGHYVGDS